MSSFNVVSGGRQQVLIDEQQLHQVQAELIRRGQELERLKASMETLSAVNAPARFMAAAMALCNELASRWDAERVGIGFLRGRYVRLKALSHTEKITRNMQLVQDIEAAMEECLDQDVEVLLPPPKEASFVYRSTEILATRHGPNAICCLPLRRVIPGQSPDDVGRGAAGVAETGTVVAVLSVERKAEKPFKLDEIETLRLTCDLFTARLVDLYEHDRWIGAKAAKATRRGLAWAVGAKHTWGKVAAIAVAGFLAFAALVDGPFRVEAPFAFEALDEQIVTAPIAGFIKTVNPMVREVDMVLTPETAGHFEDLNRVSPLVQLVPIPLPPSVLATLDTNTLETQLTKAKADYASHVREADLYRREEKEAEAEMSESQAKSSQAEIDYYQDQIDRAVIHAPIDGVIFSGDLKSKVGAPVRDGDELFRIGTLKTLRAELSVPEDQIGYMLRPKDDPALTGTMKLTSFPSMPIGFSVEQIIPMAEVKGTKNVFKVRVKLNVTDMKPWMRPGMEGLAKVDVGRARYAWLWTHRMINWVRLKLWM